MEQKKSKKKSMWSWSISGSELKNQVENYDKLRITESYRGISVLIISVLLLLSIILGFFDFYPLEDVLYGLIIYLPILFFVYKGNRWAIITLIVLWTIEKGYQLFEFGGIMPLVWWAIIIPYFYKALKIENARRKLSINQSTDSGRRFCSHCGVVIDTDAKFCTNCGKAI